MSSNPDPPAFRWRLLLWYDENARDLPWRQSHDPYAIWVSEIMLQQTRVAAVLPRYEKFLRRFPSVQQLATAKLAEVLAEWSGLGYYRRARLLHKAAQFVAVQLGGRLPSRASELRMLPGVGEYTAAAIASIGFGEPVACVDGNVERVLSRLNGRAEESRSISNVRADAARLLEPKRPGDFNQAMMELGATVCLPRAPRCAECPVRELCKTQGEHPVAKRKKMRSRELAYAFLQRTVKAKKTRTNTVEVLLEQRAADASLMPGMWELPELTAANTPTSRRALTLRHSITDTNYYVTVYELAADDRKKLPRHKTAREWFAVDNLHTIPLTGLARKALKRLRAWPGYDAYGPVVRLEDGQQRMLFQR